MTDTADWELVELRRENKPDVAFEGRLLAFADSKDEAEANPRKSAARWTELSVYELRDGSWVAVTEAISDKPGEVDFGTAIKLAAGDIRGAMEFFGWTWLAKKLAVDAGWDVVRRMDSPAWDVSSLFGGQP